jgi:cold shock CspA family protein
VVCGVICGKIVSFDSDEAYGFIKPYDGSSMVFVDAEELDAQGGFQLGTRVRFATIQGAEWRKAYNVSVLAPSVHGRQIQARRRVRGTADRRVRTCSLLSLARELTEILISACPDMTARQIAEIRDQVMALAESYGYAAGPSVSLRPAPEPVECSTSGVQAARAQFGAPLAEKEDEVVPLRAKSGELVSRGEQEAP